MVDDLLKEVVAHICAGPLSLIAHQSGAGQEHPRHALVPQHDQGRAVGPHLQIMTTDESSDKLVAGQGGHVRAGTLTADSRRRRRPRTPTTQPANNGAIAPGSGTSATPFALANAFT